MLPYIPYYCVITQYGLTKINGGDWSGYSSIAFNIVPKSCRRYYTLITKITLHPVHPVPPALYSRVIYWTLLFCAILYLTVMYLNVLYHTVPYCSILYCTLLLYYKVLYSTLQLRGAPFIPCGKFGISGTLYFTLLYLNTVKYCAILQCPMVFKTPCYTNISNLVRICVVVSV